MWQTFITSALRGLPCVTRYECAPTAMDGLALARTLRPRIVLLDLMLPDGDGVALAKELALLPHPPRVLFCTARNDSAVLLAASQPHVSGLLWKTSDLAAQLASAIASVAAGGKYYPPEVRAALRRFRADPNAFFKLLSPREIALLPHFGRGDADAEIAAGLGLSAHTVRSHRRSVMQKLDLPSTPRLIHWIIAHGFATPLTAPGARSQVPSVGCRVSGV